MDLYIYRRLLVFCKFFPTKFNFIFKQKSHRWLPSAALSWLLRCALIIQVWKSLVSFCALVKIVVLLINLNKLIILYILLAKNILRRMEISLKVFFEASILNSLTSKWLLIYLLTSKFHVPNNPGTNCESLMIRLKQVKRFFFFL